MNSRRGLVALVSVLGVALVTAASATAYVIPGHRGVGFKLMGTHGYRFTVQVSEDEREPQASIAIEIFGREGSATISSQQRVRLGADGSIDARLPGYGRIELEFVPRQVEHVASGPRCEGAPRTIELGIYRGTVSIRARRGFTEARRAVVHGRFAERPSQACKPAKHGHHRAHRAPQERTTSLRAIGRAGGLTVFFNAITFGLEATPIPSFDVLASTSRDGVSYLASGSTRKNEGTLTVPNLRTLVSATVEPGAPFTGAGTYDFLAPRKSQWTGDLAVDLPGFGRLPLVGPNFQTTLCSGPRCTSTQRNSGGGTFYAVTYGSPTDANR